MLSIHSFTTPYNRIFKNLLHPISLSSISDRNSHPISRKPTTKCGAVVTDQDAGKFRLKGDNRCEITLVVVKEPVDGKSR